MLRHLVPSPVRRIARTLLRLRYVHYNRFNARRAKSYCRVRGRRVLVVGCNTGDDCRYFVRFGAAEVWGIDVIPDVGRDFQHSRVTYHRCSAESMPFPDGSFDLIYSVATMEHVPDIARAFSEMARVAAPGGTVYCLAASLWNSRFGHHKGDLFPNDPWIHLRMSHDEIVSYANGHGITAPKGIEHYVRYMLNGEFFNKAPAQRYVDVCGPLLNMRAIINHLDMESADVLPADKEADLAAKGFPRDELLAVCHLYVGRKEMPPPKPTLLPVSGAP